MYYFLITEIFSLAESNQSINFYLGYQNHFLLRLKQHYIAVICPK